MTATIYHVPHAAETCETDGPTGDWVEVVAGEIRDAGGNVLFAGTADECVTHQAGYVSGIYTERWPTKTVPLPGGTVECDCDHLWEMADAK